MVDGKQSIDRSPSISGWSSPRLTAGDVIALDYGNAEPIHHILRALVQVENPTLAEDPCQPEEGTPLTVNYTSCDIVSDTYHTVFHSKIRRYCSVVCDHGLDVIATNEREEKKRKKNSSNKNNTHDNK